MNDSASEIDRGSNISYRNRPQSNRFTSYNHNSLLQQQPANWAAKPTNNLNDESVVINSDRGSLRIIEVSQELPSVSTPIAQSFIG